MAEPIPAIEVTELSKRYGAPGTGVLAVDGITFEVRRGEVFGRLSRGMKRALTIAAALAHRPEVIFLDEPTTGLDVISARGLRQTAARLRGEGVTVFLTTHYLEEAERLCDRVALIVGGKIVALDTVDGLKAQVQGTTSTAVVLDDENGGTETQRIVDDDVAAAVRTALTQAETQGRRVLAVNTIRPAFEDAFVQLTGLKTEAMLAEKGGREK
ncbi:MAG: AAA family ATPase [Anaerolineae bacterium]|nr:AAA family ATPase [Anaerolineae bacterium]